MGSCFSRLKAFSLITGVRSTLLLPYRRPIAGMAPHVEHRFAEAIEALVLPLGGRELDHVDCNDSVEQVVFLDGSVHALDWPSSVDAGSRRPNVDVIPGSAYRTYASCMFPSGHPRSTAGT